MTSCTSLSASALTRGLLTADYVFVREDDSKPSLSPLYRGSYKVLERFEKFFILKIDDKSNSVSIDRLKAVYSSVRFEVPVLATKLCRNPHRMV